jgi:hypothetical protein
MSSEIVVFETYMEEGKQGPKRLFVYHNGKHVNSHTAKGDWDVNRIKQNYESSFNESVRIRKGD